MRRRAWKQAHRFGAELQTQVAALSAGPYGQMLVDATDPEGPIVWVNKRFEKMTGYSAAEVIGRNARFLQGDDRDQKGLKELRRAIRDQREISVLVRNYRKDGSMFLNDLTITPVRNDQGRVIQFSGVLQDVTDREYAERRLSTQLSVIRALAETTALEDAAVRILEAFCEGQEWDAGVFWMLDARTQTLRCITHWHVSGLDLESFEQFCRDNPQPRQGGLPGYVWTKGEPVWIADLRKETQFPETPFLEAEGLLSACGFPVVNREGVQGLLTFYSRKMWPLNKNLILLMVGTGSQISKFIVRQAHPARSQEAAAIERGLAEFMGDGLLVMDGAGYCLYANKSAGRMLGYDVAELLGSAMHERLHPPDRVAIACDPDSCLLLRALQSTEPRHWDAPQGLWKKEGDVLVVTSTTSPIIDHGVIRGVALTFNEVSDRQNHEVQWQEQLAEKEAALQEAYRQIEALRSDGSTGRPIESPAAETSAAETESPRRLTVLLLEEDKVLRIKTAQILRRSGHRVLRASNAGEALLFCERSQEPVDLLITDLMLSHMSGKALAQRLSTLHPGLKTLYISIYTPGAVAEMGLLEPGMSFLQKPLNAEPLQEFVEKLSA
jgi:PAS domain S-box-containing protein